VIITARRESASHDTPQVGGSGTGAVTFIRL
jgi:hypothetical protein